jgi:hypothetical protein
MKLISDERLKWTRHSLRAKKMSETAQPVSPTNVLEWRTQFTMSAFHSFISSLSLPPSAAFSSLAHSFFCAVQRATSKPTDINFFIAGVIYYNGGTTEK